MVMFPVRSRQEAGLMPTGAGGGESSLEAAPQGSGLQRAERMEWHAWAVDLNWCCGTMESA